MFYRINILFSIVGNRIYVKDLVSMGVETGKAHLRPTKCRVVLPNKSYAGEVSVAVAFTLDV